MEVLKPILIVLLILDLTYLCSMVFMNAVNVLESIFNKKSG
jgi:hypothetical protein